MSDDSDIDIKKFVEESSKRWFGHLKPRDPDRIDIVLSLLKNYWDTDLRRDQRLGQILVNLSRPHDVFYFEDKDLIEKLKEKIQ
jgi:hypothetical protein